MTNSVVHGSADGSYMKTLLQVAEDLVSNATSAIKGVGQLAGVPNSGVLDLVRDKVLASLLQTLLCSLACLLNLDILLVDTLEACQRQCMFSNRQILA